MNNKKQASDTENNRTHGWAKLYFDLRYYGLSMEEWLVYGYIANRQTLSEGVCKAAIDTMAEDLGISPTDVKLAIASLIYYWGLIERVFSGRESGKSSRYIAYDYFEVLGSVPETPKQQQSWKIKTHKVTPEMREAYRAKVAATEMESWGGQPMTRGGQPVTGGQSQADQGVVTGRPVIDTLIDNEVDNTVEEQESDSQGRDGTAATARAAALAAASSTQSFPEKGEALNAPETTTPRQQAEPPPAPVAAPVPAGDPETIEDAPFPADDCLAIEDKSVQEAPIVEYAFEHRKNRQHMPVVTLPECFGSLAPEDEAELKDLYRTYFRKVRDLDPKATWLTEVELRSLRREVLKWAEAHDIREDVWAMIETWAKENSHE